MPESTVLFPPEPFTSFFIRHHKFNPKNVIEIQESRYSYYYRKMYVEICSIKLSIFECKDAALHEEN